MFSPLASCATAAGDRHANEDVATVLTEADKLLPGCLKALPNFKAFLGVYDGHGGSHCSRFLARELHLSLAAHIQRATSLAQTTPASTSSRLVDSSALLECFQKAFVEVDQSFLETARELQWQSGSCAAVALLLGDLLLVGHVGDSRVLVVSSPNKMCCLTKDHNAKVLSERERVKSAGGLHDWEDNRIYASERPEDKWAGLAVTRAFGDLSFKRHAEPPMCVISVVPDVCSTQLSESCAVVVASDGLFDVMTNQQVAEFIGNYLSEEKKEERPDDALSVAESLVAKARACGCRDDVTCVVLFFRCHEKKTAQPTETTPTTSSSITTTTTTTTTTRNKRQRTATKAVP